MREAIYLVILLVILCVVPRPKCQVKPAPPTTQIVIKIWVPTKPLTEEQKKQLEWLAMPRIEQNRILRERAGLPPREE
jgi:hypothetical protein